MVKTSLSYAQEACATIMNEYTPEQLGVTTGNNGLFTYLQGLFLKAMSKVYELTGDKKYLDYIIDWVDSTLDENGKIKECGWWVSLQSLDFRQPGLLLIPLYKHTGDEKYIRLVEYLAESLTEFPTNSYGGFWHSMEEGMGKNEMWLDGLYMAGPLCTSYGAFKNKPEFIDLGVNQIELMWDNMRGEGSNLLRHGWDDTKQAAWADKETGLSDNIWARSMGWYVVAICEMLDDIPKEHPERSRIEEILKTALLAVVDVQDKQDGRWYEVLDMPGREGNWLENSASCLFVYAIDKAIKMGLLEKEYIENARRGYEGIINSTGYSASGELLIGNICVGTCIESGTYEHYINRDTCINDLHGSGAFILMCSQVDF